MSFILSASISKQTLNATLMLMGIFLALIPVDTLAKDSFTIKTKCLSAFAFKTPDEARQTLLLSAKRDAVNEIFGEMISSSTAVQDFELAKDEIQSASVGLIRINGSVEFFNASGFGEVCATIHAFAKDEDFERFEPTILSKKACHTDQNRTTRELKELTRVLARQQALTQYEPGLQAYSENQILPLLKRWKIEEEGFIAGTETFCVQVTGVAVPIEVSAFLKFRNPAPEPSKFDLSHNIDGKYVGNYRCGAQVEAYFDLHLDYDGSISGNFQWREQNGPLLGEVTVKGIYNPELRSADMKIDKWTYRGGGRYYGTKITFSENFKSLSGQHFQLSNCNTTYYKMD